MSPNTFSKKVLDRANTIEFSEVNLSLEIVSTDYKELTPLVDINNVFLKTDYLVLKDCLQTKNNDLVQQTVAVLENINDILIKANLHVGYRIRDEICFYMIHAIREEIFNFDTSLDYQIMQKILPRMY